MSTQFVVLYWCDKNIHNFNEGYLYVYSQCFRIALYFQITNLAWSQMNYLHLSFYPDTKMELTTISSGKSCLFPVSELIQSS